MLLGTGDMQDLDEAIKEFLSKHERSEANLKGECDELERILKNTKTELSSTHDFIGTLQQQH
jgi:hypothetical protein